MSKVYSLNEVVFGRGSTVLFIDAKSQMDSDGGFASLGPEIRQSHTTIRFYEELSRLH